MDINALQGIVVIAHPELLEVRHQTVVSPTATAGAVLYHDIRIFRTNTLQRFHQSQVVVYVQVGLFMFWQIGRAVVLNGGIGIPLDIGYLGILREQVVHDGEDVVLHLRVGHVQHQLCASASEAQFASFDLQCPFGMAFKEFAGGVGRLRFNPYTKLYAVGFGSLRQCANAVGQFALIHHPITQGGVVAVALVFSAKPAIVHHKEFATHTADILYHVYDTFFGNVKIDSFPGVEEHFAYFISLIDHTVISCPSVECSADIPQTIITISEC